MNTDIRLSVSFRGHRKRKRLRKVLGPDSTDFLIDLWIGAAMNHPSGILRGMDETDIALEAGWEGESQTFVAALVECGFLEKTESGTYALHDWADHQGYVVHAEARSQKAKKAAAARWAGEDATSMPVACSEHASSNAQFKTSNAPSPIPAPTPTPKPKIKAESKDSSPELTSQPAGAQPGAANNLLMCVPVITLPLNTGEEHPVTQSEIDQWKDLYPSVDVLQALRNMRGWLIGNAKRRKTKSGIGRFIQAWLAKEQDKGGSLPALSSPQANQRPVATTQFQKSRQDMEDLASAVLEADRRLKNDDNFTNNNGTWQNGNALPAANDPTGVTGSGGIMGRVVPRVGG